MTMNDDTSTKKDVEFHGNSFDVIAGFPKKIREPFTQSLESLRWNATPPLRVKNVTNGHQARGHTILEIKKNGKPAYRVVYTLKNGLIHVLHAYSKTSDGTPSKEKKTVNARIKDL